MTIQSSGIKILTLILSAFCIPTWGDTSCYPPVFHHQITENLTRVRPSAVYTDVENTLQLFFLGYTYNNTVHFEPNDTAIHYFNSSDFENWQNNFYVFSALTSMPHGGEMNYIVYDKYNSSHVFDVDEDGAILAVFLYGNYHVYSYERKDFDFRRVCSPCGSFDYKTSPASWITPVRWQEKQLWLTMNYNNFLTSADLIHWSTLYPLGPYLVNSDEDSVLVEEIFTVAHPITGAPQWIALCKDYKTYNSFYNYFQLNDTGVVVQDNLKKKFDYGPDLQELAVMNEYQYGPPNVLVIGMVSNLYANTSTFNPCWTLTTSYVRNMSLVYNGGLRLAIFYYNRLTTPVTYNNVIVNQPMWGNLLSGVTAKSFKLSAVIRSSLLGFIDGFGSYDIRFLKKDSTHYAAIEYSNNKICLNRLKTSLPATTNPNRDYYSQYGKACVDDVTVNGMDLDIFCDRSVVEVFHKSGLFTITAVVFSDSAGNQLETSYKPTGMLLLDLFVSVQVEEIKLQIYQSS